VCVVCIVLEASHEVWTQAEENFDDNMNKHKSVSKNYRLWFYK
jgi:hypothetical protein